MGEYVQSTLNVWHIASASKPDATLSSMDYESKATVYKAKLPHTYSKPKQRLLTRTTSTQQGLQKLLTASAEATICSANPASLSSWAHSQNICPHLPCKGGTTVWVLVSGRWARVAQVESYGTLLCNPHKLSTPGLNGQDLRSLELYCPVWWLQAIHGHEHLTCVQSELTYKCVNTHWSSKASIKRPQNVRYFIKKFLH